MKILMIGHYFYPVVGGVEIHMMNLARDLIKRGHSVVVFTSNSDFSGQRLPESDTVNGIRIIRFRSIPSLMSFIKSLKPSDYDVIHCHLFRSVFVAFSVIAGKKAGFPLVLTTHGVFPSLSFGMSVKKFVFDKTLGHMVLSRVNRIIALTESDRQAMIDLGADLQKIDIVPNSIRFEDFLELSSGDLFKQEFRIDNFILYVGRLDWNKGKGLEYVIQAMPKIKQLGLKLVIIGEDMGYKAKLIEMVKKLNMEDSIIFTGKVSFDLLLSAYAACTLFMLPSFYEGLPTVVLEAMAYKKPAVAARTGGTQYVIRHGHNGFLFEYGNPDDIYRKVNEALDSNLQMIGINARKDVEENYTWAHSTESIEKVYLKVLGVT